MRLLKRKIMLLKMMRYLTHMLMSWLFRTQIFLLAMLLIVTMLAKILSLVVRLLKKKGFEPNVIPPFPLKETVQIINDSKALEVV